MFVSLLAKIIPQETRSSVLVAYQSMPIGVTVEEREPVPELLEAPSAIPVLSGPITVQSETDADF